MLGLICLCLGGLMGCGLGALLGRTCSAVRGSSILPGTSCFGSRIGSLAIHGCGLAQRVHRARYFIFEPMLADPGRSS